MICDRDLHKSLKSEMLLKVSVTGLELALVKLMWGKEDVAFSLHVAPKSYSTSGIQIPDFLSYLGFSRQSCSFLGNECYVKQVDECFNLDTFGQAFGEAYQQLIKAEQHLQSCGFFLKHPEGWGYFFGKQSGGHSHNNYLDYTGDGHTSSTTPQIIKNVEDDAFYFVFTWIENGEHSKGWTIHYRPKHPPLSIELQGVFRFLGIKDFNQCPQFEFEPCSWRHIKYQQLGDRFFDGNAEIAHRFFDSHQQNFSPGVKALLTAQEIMERVGMGFLPSFERPETRRSQEIKKRITTLERAKESLSKTNPSFDVAISFAGTERNYAEAIANKVKAAGFNVFYDDFYPEVLWGKNLVEFFHEIYSKNSRYCVILVSNEYLKREWTVHERKSAQERMLREKGNEYILPIKIEDVELPGLPSTIGYLSISTGIERIADILIKKLEKNR